jgi:hypothetical protein
MEEIKTDKLIYYYDGQRHEIPIHLRRVKLTGDFLDVTQVDINAVCKNDEETEGWKRLIDCLLRIRRERIERS